MRRWWKFKVAAFRAQFDRILLRYDQWRCPHTWRPAKIGSKLGKVCKICDKPRILEPAQYFAEFGEQGFGLVGK